MQDNKSPKSQAKVVTTSAISGELIRGNGIKTACKAGLGFLNICRRDKGHAR